MTKFWPKGCIAKLVFGFRTHFGLYSKFTIIDTVGVLTSTGDFHNFGLLDQVKLVYPRDQQANFIIPSQQTRQEQLDSWQLGAKKMKK